MDVRTFNLHFFQIRNNNSFRLLFLILLITVIFISKLNLEVVRKYA